MYHPQGNQNGLLERATSGAVLRRKAPSLLLLSATDSGSKTALALPMVPYNVPPTYGVAFFPHHRRARVLFSFCETLPTYLKTSFFSTLKYFTQRFPLILGSMATLFSVTSALLPAQCHGGVSEFEGFYNNSIFPSLSYVSRYRSCLISSKYTRRSNDKVTENEWMNEKTLLFPLLVMYQL